MCKKLRYPPLGQMFLHLWMNPNLSAILPGCCCYLHFHPLIFYWTAFSLDYGRHPLWHRFDKLMQCHNIYFSPELHPFFTKILYWYGSWGLLLSPLQHIPKIFNGFKVKTLWWWSMCENDVSCSLKQSFTVWAGWIVALSSCNTPVPSGKTNKKNKQKNIVGKNLVLQYIQVVNIFWVTYSCNIAEPGLYQLNQPSYADAPISLQQGKSGLIKPHDLFPCSKGQSLCSQAKWSLFIQLASLISGFLKATQEFSPNPLSSVNSLHVEMLLLSLLNIAMSSTVFFFYDLSDLGSLFWRGWFTTVLPFY